MMTPEDLARKLNLVRPLVFMDMESTPVEEGGRPNPQTDRIVEIGIMKFYPDGRVTAFSTLVNPGIPIAKSATSGDGGRFKGHGITNEDVAGAQTFKQVGRIIVAGIRDSDLAGFNARRYDFELLLAECDRNGLNYTGEGVHIVDQYLLWAMKEPRDLSAFVQRVTGEIIEPGHRGGQDVAAAVSATLGMFDVWPDLPTSVPELSALCWKPNPAYIHPKGKIQWRGDVPTVCFGKYNEKPMQRVPRDYWEYIIREGPDPAMRRLAEDALADRYPVRGTLPFEPVPQRENDTPASDNAAPAESAFGGMQKGVVLPFGSKGGE